MHIIIIIIPISVQIKITHQMPKWCVEIWYNILEEAVGNLSSPKHRPLSSGTRIHSDVCYKIILL